MVRGSIRGAGEAIRLRFVPGWTVAVLAIAFGFNFVWEMAQASLYVSMGSVWEATRRCLVASVGDAALVMGVLVSTSAVAGRASAEVQYALNVAFALVVAVAVESWGLSQGRWAYLPAMPRVPGTALGVVPLLQLAVLTPMTMWLAGRAVAARG